MGKKWKIGRKDLVEMKNRGLDAGAEERSGVTKYWSRNLVNKVCWKVLCDRERVQIGVIKQDRDELTPTEEICCLTRLSSTYALAVGKGDRVPENH